jgi:hypothetical protein
VQFLNSFKQEAGVFIKENATLLLTAGGVVGTVGTGVLAARGGMKYVEVLRRYQEEAQTEELGLVDPEQPLPQLDKMVKVKLAVPYFGPPILLGSVTIASIIMSHRMSAQKIAGLAAAYGLAERNFSEYKEKVAEKLTGPKNKALGEEISQDRVNRTDGYQNVVIIEGEVLCFDEATDRYFNSTMEKIRSAVNATNAEILNGMGGYADASFFYNELGLKDTKWSGEVGWNSDHLCELKYDTIRAPDGRPCISIIFENFPKSDFIRKNY